ncbi:unnamed protein product [Arctia plantaginis]|uniref:Ataxin-2 C-terminal domain-containing protein n=1 Tax=Arctia plantaginis TaxID=874455 RepID=A0A8S1ACI6_ARCPL|nr:unnamed protein product [Arctia plantaginis]
MKIPETSANVGAYYGNEENGQWQPNGVIIDSGVGGGIVGSGDAGIHRPPVYPVHLPRGHMPGYVMAGAYYPPAAYPPVPAPAQDDFADYMWMENEEEFDKQVMQQLEEEALMEQCIEAMLEDEQRERHNRPTANGHNHHYPTTSNGTPSLSLEETVSKSKLNPLAAEFVPTGARPAKEERQNTPDAPVTVEPTQKTEEAPSEETTPVEKVEDEETKTGEPVPPQKDPPEVSAADVPPIDKTQKSPPKEVKKEPVKQTKVDPKKPAKIEVKPKVKPVAVKSETKVQPKKKEVKTVKSDTKTEDSKTVEETPAEVTKPQPTSTEESQPSSGFKPINYAAAAKANKPKKPSPTPSTEKQQPQPQPAKTEKVKTEKVDKKVDKLKSDKLPAKTEKVNVQRKNSAK